MLKNEKELSIAAANMYVLFKAYINAGFTEEQAIQLLVGMIRPVQNVQ